MKARSRPAESRKKPAKGADIVPPAPLPAPAAAASGAGADVAEKLTPEEQMERFARELKNEDWGHQPC